MTSTTAVHAAPDRSAPDHRDPLLRMSRLLDPGSLRLLRPGGTVAVSAATGLVNGLPVVTFCTDASRMGGAVGAAECDVIVEAIDHALLRQCPVIGLWHSGGAKLTEGVESMDGIGRVFAAMIRASGRIPQLSVVLGPAAGGAAYGPALTDIIIMSDAGRIFITGPDVVRAVTGEQTDMAGLGGPQAHGTKSGVAHLTVPSEESALEHARQLVSLLAEPATSAPVREQPEPALRDLLPESTRRAYDVRPLVRALLDDGLIELQPKWAPNIVVGLGRLAGRAIGVVANNPIRRGGCLDSRSAEKAARFVRMCDSLGVPLLVVTDVPGYLPGVGQEWGGVVRRGAKLLYAFAEATVPRVTLVTRKSYGGAYIAMNSRALGATAVFAWPEAEVAVMGARAAVEILHRKRIAATAEDEREALLTALTAEQERTAGGVARAVAMGVVDEVIDPADTRLRIAEVLAASPVRRGAHGNIPL
jgi:acetyl-CoA/propionyl-CoA carboxylase carboxyl transferase subunit